MKQFENIKTEYRNKITTAITIMIMCLPGTAGIYSQTSKKVSGHLLDELNNPIPGIEVSFDNATGNKDTTDATGYYEVTATDFPVGIEPDLKKPDLKLTPGEVTVRLTDILGRSHDIQKAQLMPDGSLQGLNNNPLKPFTYYNRTIIDKEGVTITEKFAIAGTGYGKLPNVAEQKIQTQDIGLKSASFETAQDPTHGYKLALKAINGQTIKDTIVDVIGFYTYLAEHTQDITSNVAPTFTANPENQTMYGNTLEFLLSIYNDNETEFTVTGNGEITQENDQFKFKLTAEEGKDSYDIKITAIDKQNPELQTESNFTVQQGILLKGKTIDLVKDTSQSYIVTDAEFIQKRIEPNLEFDIFDKEGNTQRVTSDENGNYQVGLLNKGDYGIQIISANMHPMMYKIIVDSIVNNELIAAVDTTLSMYNFAQSHQGYKPSDEDITKLIAGNGLYSRTLNLSKQLREEGTLSFFDQIYDFQTKTLGDTINQEMIDIIQNTMNHTDKYTNNFFGNKTFGFTNDLAKFDEEGNISFAYMENYPFGGGFGFAFKDEVVSSMIISINKLLYDQLKEYNHPRIFAGSLKEHSSPSAGAFYELWNEDKPSVFFKSIPNNRHEFTEDSKKASIVYQWISNKLISENADKEGFFAPLLDSRMAKEFNSTPQVQTFIENFAFQNIKNLYLN